MNIKFLYENRALILEEERSGKENRTRKRYLVVGDLHIGFEEKFKIEGISIGSNVDSIREEIQDLITKHKISNLVINGDVKSGTDRISGSEWENIPLLFRKLVSLCEVTVVPGNHDAGLFHLIPEQVELADSSGVLIGQTLVLHGFTKPLSKFSDCKRLVVGHLHPIYQERGSPLSGQPVWMVARVSRAKIFESVFGVDSSIHQNEHSNSRVEVVVMPSFNKDLVFSGFARLAGREERKIAPILQELKNAEEALILTLNGEIIGDSTLLSRVL